MGLVKFTSDLGNIFDQFALEYNQPNVDMNCREESAC